ncbi:MAG TPA: T9SS type A sorting domain-containing protein [Candidatus Acidoferrales bacterium]|nr:T9SS type A sorting domain-containing protein [Candidatus Acidoferrales bacterium]
MKNRINIFIFALLSVAMFYTNAEAWGPTCTTSATYQPGTYYVGDLILFDASASSPLGNTGGRTPFWGWDFDYNAGYGFTDELPTYTPQCYHAFSTPGTHTVAVRYTDGYGTVGQVFTMTITILNWDWTTDLASNLYYGGASPFPYSTKLPWFDNSPYPPYMNIGEGAYSLGNIDFLQSEGWTLVFKNFGTTASLALSDCPCFILYNRYTGVLRFFFWNYLLSYQNYGMVNLTITGENATPLFTFNNGVPQFSDGYKGGQDLQDNLSVITQLVHNHWGFADFKLLGYDPYISQKYCNLNFQIFGVDTTHLTISGGLSLNGIIGGTANSLSLQTSGGGGGPLSDINSALGWVSKEVKNDTTLWTDLKGIDKQLTKGWATQALSDLLTIGGGIPALIPGIGQIAGLATNFIGILTGSGKGNQLSAPAPITLKGTISLSGDSKTVYPISGINIPLPGSSAAIGPNENVLYNNPLGIFNVTTEPTLRYCNLPEDVMTSGFGGEAFGPFDVGLDPIQIQYNPCSGLSLVNASFAILDTNYGPQTAGYHPVDSCAYIQFVLDKYQYECIAGWEWGQPCDIFCGVPTAEGPSPYYNGIGVSLKLKFKYFNSSTSTWDTVYFLKTYPVNIVADTSVFDRPAYYDKSVYSPLHDWSMKSPRPVRVTSNIPSQYSVKSYPNPFNPTTNINYQVPKDSRVKLMIYDAIGREVTTLADGTKKAGYYSATFDGSRLSSGIYFIRLVARPADGSNMVIQTQKVMLVK